jgi:basic amino acid/polyamine antiporter, APA family
MSEQGVKLVGGGGQGLFLRQSSGLVREIPILGALFFNVTAFMGPYIPGGLNYGLAGEPNPVFLGLTAYAWAAILVGVFSVTMVLITTGLVTVMPRTGGGYVFTSRITHPLLGWVESWGVIMASLALVGFVAVLLVGQIRSVGEVLAAAFPSSSTFHGAATWISSRGAGFTVGIIALILAGGISVMRPKAFFRIITWAAGIALGLLILLVIVAPLTVHPSTLAAKLPHFTGGATEASIIAHSGFPTGALSFPGFMVVCVVIFGAIVGFQYSAYLAGELAGGVRRSALYGIMGALVLAVLMNSVFNDIVARRFGIHLMGAYAMYVFGGKPLPGGLVPLPQVLATIAAPHLWPLWTLSVVATVVFTFLLIPVYVVFIARILLAWSLDRQAPEWFGRVNERTNTPVNATLVCVVVGAIILYLSTYQGLALDSTLWFVWLTIFLTLVDPAINAILLRWRRPDLFRNAPFNRLMLPFGITWLIVVGMIYGFGVFKPLVAGITGAAGGSYFVSSGILAAVVALAVGVVLYFVNVAWNRHNGVDRAMLYAAIPPD